jgi:predicted GTPase
MEAIPRKFSPEELVALTAAERRQLGAHFDAQKALQEIALRQWCVEQACKSPDYIDEAATIVSVAQSILDFVTAPLKPEVPK